MKIKTQINSNNFLETFYYFIYVLINLIQTFLNLSTTQFNRKCILKKSYG